ncbi:MAG: hypothetical protein LBU83_05985 [Bacteroidales bacterium]|nr:hypothetical protein [Bacteroidales bacterium]
MEHTLIHKLWVCETEAKIDTGKIRRKWISFWGLAAGGASNKLATSHTTCYFTITFQRGDAPIAPNPSYMPYMPYRQYF